MQKENNKNKSYMDTAIKLSLIGASKGEVPVGAIIVHNPTNKIISKSYNTCEKSKNSIRHAEILAIDQACSNLKSKYLKDCTIYVTLEPCAMCAMALSHVKIQKIVFGAYDYKSGGVEHGAMIYKHKQTHHKPQVIGGIQEQECKTIIQNFFKNKR